MSKHNKLILQNKKNSRQTNRGALAAHSSIKRGHLLENPAPQPTQAQAFFKQLKTVIRQAVK